MFLSHKFRVESLPVVLLRILAWYYIHRTIDESVIYWKYLYEIVSTVLSVKASIFYSSDFLCNAHTYCKLTIIGQRNLKSCNYANWIFGRILKNHVSTTINQQGTFETVSEIGLSSKLSIVDCIDFEVFEKAISKLFVVLVFYHCISRWKVSKVQEVICFKKTFDFRKYTTWIIVILHIFKILKISSLFWGTCRPIFWRFAKSRWFMWYTFENQKFFQNKWLLEFSKLFNLEIQW